MGQKVIFSFLDDLIWIFVNVVPMISFRDNLWRYGVNGFSVVKNLETFKDSLRDLEAVVMKILKHKHICIT